MTAAKRRWFQLSLWQLLMITALIPLGAWQWWHCQAATADVFLTKSILIGVTFGAAIGVLFNQVGLWIRIGALGWAAFGMYAVLA